MALSAPLCCSKAKHAPHAARIRPWHTAKRHSSQTQFIQELTSGLLSLYRMAYGAVRQGRVHRTGVRVDSPIRQCEHCTPGCDPQPAATTQKQAYGRCIRKMSIRQPHAPTHPRSPPRSRLRVGTQKGVCKRRPLAHPQQHATQADGAQGDQGRCYGTAQVVSSRHPARRQPRARGRTRDARVVEVVHDLRQERDTYDGDTGCVSMGGGQSTWSVHHKTTQGRCASPPPSMPQRAPGCPGSAR